MNSLFIKIDDFCNAILIKELRQSVRGKFIWSVLGIFLAVQCGIFLLSNSDGLDYYSGSEIVEYLIGCLLFCCIFLIPINIGKKVGRERNDGTNELLLTTIMTSKQIITGKFLCGFVENTMMFCTVAPFCLITVFMGGVDLTYLISAMFLGYVVSLLAVMFQIIAGLESNYSSVVANYAVKLFSLIVQFIIWISTTSFLKEIENNSLEWISGNNIIIFGGVVLLSSLVIWFLLFKFGLTILEPASSNRNYSFRVYMTLAIIVGMFIFVSFEELRIPLAIAQCIVIAIVAGMIYSEPEYYTDRVVKEIPSSLVLKLIKFPLFTGFANGLSWVILISIISLGFVNLFSPSSFFHVRSFSDSCHILEISVLIGFMINGYGLLANVVRKFFFSNKSRKENFGIGFVLYLVLGILPSFFTSMRRSSQFFNIWIGIFNPLWISSRHDIKDGLMVSSVTMILGILFNIVPIGKQICNYFKSSSIENEEN